MVKRRPAVCHLRPLPNISGNNLREDTNNGRKKTVILDLTGCKYLGEIHQRIKEAFDFPDFYGENWDAFWDLLRSECDADKVEVLGEDTVSKELEPSIETMNEILQELKEHRAEYGELVEIEIRS